MPGGVNSPVRAFRAVGGEPLFISKASGPRVTDADGNEYLDLVMSWGALIHGHAHPNVVRAISEAAGRGTSYGAPHSGEIDLARRIVAAIPVIEKVRFVNSGTEAVMSAVRLARAATNRPLILKFEGGYHGHVDALMVKGGSGVATLGLPDSAGVPKAFTDLTLIARYNSLESVANSVASRGNEVAAILVEPVAGNMGVVPPLPGFLEGLRKIASEIGALLVFDEVITGFRVGFGGAIQRYGVTPDLVCLGKIIGGGVPVGAYGGRAELMDWVAPEGPMYQAGTLSGNPLAMAAGVEQLALLDDHGYRDLETKGAWLESGIVDAAESAGVQTVVNRVGSMLTPFFTDQPTTDFESAKETNRKFYAQLFHACLEEGLMLPPSALESWFVSTAHTAQDLNSISQILSRAFRTATNAT